HWIRGALRHARSPDSRRPRIPAQPSLFRRPLLQRRAQPHPCLLQGHAVAPLPNLLQPGYILLMRWRLPIRQLVLLVAIALVTGPHLRAQEILDRIAARVENDVILLSEVRELSAYQKLVDG